MVTFTRHWITDQVFLNNAINSCDVWNLPLEDPLLFSIVFFKGISNQLFHRTLSRKGIHHKYFPLNFTKLFRAATRCIFRTLPNICLCQTSIFAKELHRRCLTRCWTCLWLLCTISFSVRHSFEKRFRKNFWWNCEKVKKKYIFKQIWQSEYPPSSWLLTFKYLILTHFKSNLTEPLAWAWS